MERFSLVKRGSGIRVRRMGGWSVVMVCCYCGRSARHRIVGSVSMDSGRGSSISLSSRSSIRLGWRWGGNDRKTSIEVS